MKKNMLGMVSVVVILLIFVSCGENKKAQEEQLGQKSAKSAYAPQRPMTTMEKTTRIAFESTLMGAFDIFTMYADGTDIQQLTNGQGRNQFPAWSPDGTKIVFGSTRRLQNTLDIYVMDADGKNLTMITKIPGWNGHPDWSPDGSKIAFETAKDKNFEIYIMKPDGTDLVNLTNHPKNDTKPKWSPDGSRILFVSKRMTMKKFML